MGEKHDLSILEDPCPDEVKDAIAAELAKSASLAHFSGRIRKAKSIAAVNRVLAAVFDEADRMHVWCGI